MKARAIDRKQVAIVAAIRSGVALSILAEKVQLDEKRLTEINAEYQGVPDEILFGLNRLFDDNLRLKSVIADLIENANQS